MNWNEGYTQRKQKEMVEQQILQSKKQKPPASKPLYQDHYSSRRSNSYITQREKERRFWIFGGVLWGIVTMGGIAAVIWALST